MGEKTIAEMLEAALISGNHGVRRDFSSDRRHHLPLSPVTTSQTSPLAVQWTSGYKGERPGTVMFLARILNSGMPYQTSPSGGNCK